MHLNGLWQIFQFQVSATKSPPLPFHHRRSMTGSFCQLSFSCVPWPKNFNGGKCWITICGYLHKYLNLWYFFKGGVASNLDVKCLWSVCVLFLFSSAMILKFQTSLWYRCAYYFSCAICVAGCVLINCFSVLKQTCKGSSSATMTTELLPQKVFWWFTLWRKCGERALESKTQVFVLLSFNHGWWGRCLPSWQVILTLLGANTSHPSRHFWVNYFPFSSWWEMNMRLLPGGYHTYSDLQYTQQIARNLKRPYN